MNLTRVILVALALSMSGCSSISRIRSDEASQTAAMAKVNTLSKKKDTETKAKLGAIANLTQQVKFLLTLPATAKTVPVETQLLDEQLTLTGAPSVREGILEAEVKDLLDTQQKNEAAMAQIQKRDEAVQDALDTTNKKLVDAKGEVTKTTARLYSASEFFAAKADEWNGFISDLRIAAFVAAAVLVLCLWLKFGTKAAEATTAVASKV